MCSTLASASSRTALALRPSGLYAVSAISPGRRRQLAQDRAFADDVRVVPDVRGRRHVLHQRAQIGEPADIVELLHGRQRLRQRHDVDGLALAAKLIHVAEDQTVRFAVEIVFGDDVADAVGGFVVEQQPA